MPSNPVSMIASSRSPIAPQVWHAYHIAGEQLAIGIAAFTS